MTRALVLMLSCSVPALWADGREQAGDVTVDLRGRVVCLGESGSVEPCAAGRESYALAAVEGPLRPFLAEDSLAAMFRDARVRERELVIRARPVTGGAIEIVKVYSLRNGRPHDLYYFCEVCNITAYAPGPCPCCRQDMELRETPHRGSHADTEARR